MSTTLNDARDTYPVSLAFLTTRDEIPFLLNARGLVGCGVEVGVKQGMFSERLLRDWQGRHLISVDPWSAADPLTYVDIANVSDAQHERYFQETQARLQQFGDRSTIWRRYSTEAALLVPHHALDFVYLDARHDYEAVLEDLNAWFDTVRPGGILAGHNYLDGKTPDGEFGVKRAVDEFCGARGIRVFHTHVDLPYVSWMIEIPKPEPMFRP